MNFEIERIFDEAYQVCEVYCGDCVEDYIMDFIFEEYLPSNEKLEKSFLIEFRPKPFENPIYIFAMSDEDSEYHLLVLTHKDAVESGNFVLMDEIKTFRERTASFN